MVCGLGLQTGAAIAAVGFTGNYATTNWRLTNVTNSIVTSTSKPPLTCATGSSVECVTNFNSPPGDVQLIGGYAQPSAIAQQSTLTADAPSDGVPQLLSFTMTFYGTGGDPNFYAFYQVGSGSTVQLTVPLNQYSNSITASNVYVPGNQTFTFGIYNQNSTSVPGYLNVNSFAAQPVPAPLPVVGAGAGFAWSRRLRRRLKGQAPGLAVSPPAWSPTLSRASRGASGAIRAGSTVHAYADRLAGGRIPWSAELYRATANPSAAGLRCPADDDESPAAR